VPVDLARVGCSECPADSALADCLEYQADLAWAGYVEYPADLAERLVDAQFQYPADNPARFPADTRVDCRLAG
jgi:hypothetical protein